MSRYRPKLSVMAAVARGHSLARKGYFKAALRSFNAAAAGDAACIQAYLYRAGVKVLSSDLAGAIEDFRAVSRISGEHLPAYRDLLTPSAEDHPILLARMEELLRREPGNGWAYAFHSFSLRSVMRYDEATAAMARATACEPASPALRALLARVKLTNGLDAYDGAREMGKALRLAPSWGWIHCWSGEALRHQNEPRRALRALDRGVAQDPHYRQGYAWRGGVYVVLGEYRRAVADLSRALTADRFSLFEDPDDRPNQVSWACNQRMLARRGMKDAAGAIADLNRAHALNTRYSWVFNPRGDEGIFAAGVAELDALLARRPRLPWAYAWRGRTFHQWGRPDEALRDLDKALSLSPGLAWPRAWKGQLLLDAGDLKGALACLDRALADGPEYSAAWGWRAQARRRNGDVKRAVSDFTRAIRLDYRASWAFAGRGGCRKELGDLDGALKDLDRALAIYPTYRQAFLCRSEIRGLRGDSRGAAADAAIAAEILRRAAA